MYNGPFKIQSCEINNRFFWAVLDKDGNRIALFETSYKPEEYSPSYKATQFVKFLDRVDRLQMAYDSAARHESIKVWQQIMATGFVLHAARQSLIPDTVDPKLLKYADLVVEAMLKKFFPDSSE
jgi:hypothetical protein